MNLAFLTSVVSTLSLLLASNMAQDTSGVVHFHGSGSSAGSGCLWHMVESMSVQTKIPTWATYRSIGSGSGVKEFVGNITHPYSDFGSSDYPLPKEHFESLSAAGKEMVHLPVVMGSVGIFHSVPVVQDDIIPSGSEDEVLSVNLTSCLVARIYNGDVDDWTHPDIAEINPGMKLPVQLDFYGNPKDDQSYPIKVAYRGLGSGTTNLFTTYLNKACPEHWPEELVGSEIEWPIAGNDNAIPVQGTSEMLRTIAGGEAIIGYSNSGVALDQGLNEIALKMQQTTLKDDFFLTSKNAISKDGIAAAVSSAGTPERGDVDWSGVDLVNKVEGYIYAWPMVMITYVYVRKDLQSFLPDPRAQSLMVAFLKGFYDPDIMSICEEDYLMLPVKDEVREVGLAAIDMLEVSPEAPEWTIETDVLVGEGMGDYVISVRRESSFAIQQEILTEKVNEATLTLEGIVGEIASMGTKSDTLEEKLNQVAAGGSGLDDSIAEKEGRIDAAFYMAIIGLVLWILTAVGLCLQQSKIRELEARCAVQPVKVSKKRRSSNREEEHAPDHA